jgi:hypothetical protein
LPLVQDRMVAQGSGLGVDHAAVGLRAVESIYGAQVGAAVSA